MYFYLYDLEFFFFLFLYFLTFSLHSFSDLQMSQINVIALICTVLSHIPLLKTFPVWINRKSFFEISVGGFGLLASVMYHVCQNIPNQILLFSEDQWHKLDNVGVIALIGLLFVYLSAITNKVIEKIVKYVVFFIAIASQEQHPWDVRFTVAPILLFSLIPIYLHLIVRRQLPSVDKSNLYIGLLTLLVSVVFFCLGLDDSSDPYRLIHALWHVSVGMSSWYLWQLFSTKSTAVSSSRV